MSELIARSLIFCAASSAAGATHSPITKVSDHEGDADLGQRDRRARRATARSRA